MSAQAHQGRALCLCDNTRLLLHYIRDKEIEAYMQALVQTLILSLTQINLSHFFASTICFAKHVNDKAAKWAASKRPKKSRPSDIAKTHRHYDLYSIPKPAEYTISEAAPTSVAKES
jgi:hypothetical protein